MLIRCPTCASGYELAPELIPEGRILRCAYCRDAWVHGADSAGWTDAAATRLPAGDLDHPDGPEIVAETRFFRRSSLSPKMSPPTPSRHRAIRRRRGAGWMTTLASSVLALALLGGGMMAVAAKARLVAAFPPSEAVFATLGLPVNLSGLGLGDIRSTVETGEAGSTLTLEGHITNLRTGPTPVPSLRIAVRDKSQRELYYWTAPAPKAQLAVGETVLFRSRLSAPPRDGQDLAVSFAETSAEPRRVAEVLAANR